MSLKYQIPTLLVYSRAILGFLIVAVTLFQPEFYPIYTVIFLTLGLLTDIFDGMLARRLGVSNERLRRLDSNIDQLFFICAIVSIYLQQPVFFQQHLLPILVVIASEIAIYVVSFIKFRKEVATHSLGAKIWTLFLFALLVQITLTGQSHVLFWIVFWLGMITRAEIIAIILVLRHWQNDVPSLKQALRIRKGLKVRHNRFFNG
ncbi:CDP-alcohol phosphatidyltransferase family protein [Acinetobacter sp. A47]|uniref:CDP-alcohol phosphatidyltransferase family protein n=1 Tax=Acinetobacter sp. A47 TaxID=1561217 RepID=UPI000570EC0A|nr:CDP-alcohol phosphatidyltransferase family protein [Acinetobacter sp. A47]